MQVAHHASEPAANHPGSDIPPACCGTDQPALSFLTVAAEHPQIWSCSPAHRPPVEKQRTQREGSPGKTAVKIVRVCDLAFHLKRSLKKRKCLLLSCTPQLKCSAVIAKSWIRSRCQISCVQMDLNPYVKPQIPNITSYQQSLKSCWPKS